MTDSRTEASRAPSEPAKGSKSGGGVKAQANGWTPERRARQAELIRKWKPWEKSTGPKTDVGRAAVSQNYLRSRQSRLKPLLPALQLAALSGDTGALLRLLDMAVDAVGVSKSKTSSET
jgi:hypothetical protein